MSRRKPSTSWSAVSGTADGFAVTRAALLRGGMRRNTSVDTTASRRARATVIPAIHAATPTQNSSGYRRNSVSVRENCQVSPSKNIVVEAARRSRPRRAASPRRAARRRPVSRPTPICTPRGTARRVAGRQASASSSASTTTSATSCTVKASPTASRTSCMCASSRRSKAASPSGSGLPRATRCRDHRGGSSRDRGARARRARHASARTGRPGTPPWSYSNDDDPVVRDDPKRGRDEQERHEHRDDDRDDGEGDPAHAQCEI